MTDVSRNDFRLMLKEALTNGESISDMMRTSFRHPVTAEAVE
jgi:hypothetical protein